MVLGLGIWTNSGVADVIKITANPVYINPSLPFMGFTHASASCPAGYVITGASGVTNWQMVGDSAESATATPELNSNINPTSAIFKCNSACPNTIGSSFIICAKVCN